MLSSYGAKPRSVSQDMSGSRLRWRGGLLEGAGPKDARDLLAVERLALEQGPRESVQLVDVVLQDLSRAVGAVEDDLLDLTIDGERGVLAIVLRARHLPSEEDVL